MKKWILLLICVCFINIGYTQVRGTGTGGGNGFNPEWEEMPVELTYWDDLGAVNVRTWSKEFQLMYKAYEARLQYCKKDGKIQYRLAVKYTDYDKPVYIPVIRGNYNIEGTYYNARADYYYFNMNTQNNSSKSYSNSTSRTFYPTSATINDAKGIYTSENFNCPSMTVIDQDTSVLIHWNGEKVPLQNSTYDVDTYRAYQSNTQGSVELLAYRSSSSRSIYLVVVNMRMGNEKIKINFKP